MAWSNAQKSLAVRACKAAGMSDEHRKLLLRQFANSLFDAEGNETGEPSSTSRRLTNGDYENYMATVERAAGGRINVPGHAFAAGHFQAKADDVCQRMRHLVGRLVDALIAAELLSDRGLAGWITKYVTAGEPRTVGQLHYHELHRLINGLRGYANRHGVRWQPAGQPDPEAELAEAIV